MKLFILTSVAFYLSTAAMAQGGGGTEVSQYRCGIYYDYDAVGNRIKRYYDCLRNQQTPGTAQPAGRFAKGMDESDLPGIKEKDNVIVYPNPVTDKFNIRLPKAAGNAHFHLYDAKGAIISSGNISGDHYEGNISNLPAGNYTIVVLYEGRLFNFKITRL